MSRQPQIAILGAGPTGLEAALAANERGLPFTLYEAAPRVAGHMRAWGHVKLFSPWSLNVSPRARAALEAAGLVVSDDDACPTGAELAAAVFQPLAEMPAIAPNLRLSTRVLAISRQGLLKHQEIGTGARADAPFRLLVADADGAEWVETADLVLDCTGTYGRPNWTGDGGIPAPGETALDGSAALVRRIPDLSEPAASEQWGGKTVLLVGAGHSAQTAVVDLAQLAESQAGTKIVWALRSADPQWQVDPDDPLPERSSLTRRARELARGSSPAVEVRTGVVVDSLAPVGGNGQVQVTLRSEDGSLAAVTVDRVLSLTGSVGDHRLYRQLQVHECYATSGPMKLAAALLGESSADCLDQTSHGADTLTNPEPGFFILGSKSYGRNTTFLMRVGWQQVDEVFGLLASA